MAVKSLTLFAFIFFSTMYGTTFVAYAAPQPVTSATATPTVHPVPGWISSRIRSEQRGESWQQGWRNFGIILLGFCLLAVGPIWFVSRLFKELNWWQDKVAVTTVAWEYLFLVAAGLGFLDIAATRGPTVPELGAYELLAMTCLFLGLFLGFIFGMPKSLAAAANKSGATDTASTNGGAPMQVNTSFERISEWLVTIILGLGLVELKSGAAAFPNFAQGIADRIDGQPSPFAALAGAIVIFFPMIGTFAGYLSTRLTLGPALALADADVAHALKPHLQDITSIVEMSPRQAELVSKKISETLEQQTTPEGRLAWARAQLLKQNWNEAVRGYEAVGAASSNDRDVLEEYANALYHQMPMDTAKVIATLKKARDATSDSRAKSRIEAEIVRAELYLKPQGYLTALHDADEAIRANSSTELPLLKLYRVAAYGRQYEAVRTTDGKDPNAEYTLKDLTTKIIADTKEATIGDPSLIHKFRMISLREYEAPGKDAEDDFLELFALEHPEYVANQLHVQSRPYLYNDGGG